MNESKGSKLFIGIAAVAVLLGVGATGYALLKEKPAQIETVEDAALAPQTENPRPDIQPADPLLPTIVFTDKGFTQSTYTFPDGMKIKVHNQSNQDLQFSSDNHPTHTEHTELNMRTLKPGESDTFTPAGKGSYEFHDHLNARYTGTLVIQ